MQSIGIYHERTYRYFFLHNILITLHYDNDQIGYIIQYLLICMCSVYNIIIYSYMDMHVQLFKMVDACMPRSSMYVHVTIILFNLVNHKIYASTYYFITSSLNT